MEKRIRTFSEVSAQRRNLQALHALIATIGVREPKPQEVLPVVVFMAFTFESYVNNLGYRRQPDWSKKERKPWREKVKLLHELQSTSPNWDSAPLDFASELFELRDRLAHGKPEQVDGPSFDCMGAAQEHITSSDFDPDWFSVLGPYWYKQAKDKFFALLEYMAQLHGLSPTDYLHASTNRAVQSPSYAD